jgi:hypothetical protein
VRGAAVRGPGLGDDVEEGPNVQARAAYQRAVDIRLRGQLRDIVGFDAAAVQDVALIRRIVVEPGAKASTDVRVRLLRLL